MQSDKKEIKRQIKNRMKARNEIRIGGKPKTKGLTRNEIRRGVIEQQTNFNDYKIYEKKIDIDYDVVICISSFNRYDKIKKMLTHLFSEKTNYTFKFILMNDGSTNSDLYDKLEYEFPDIIYLKNEISGGKINYWRTINSLWKKASEIKTNAIIQLDDDFILCNNFLDKLLDKFFEIKKISNNYMAFHFHIYTFSKNEPLVQSYWFNEDNIFIDGGILLDVQFLEKFNYELDDIEKRLTTSSCSFTWVRLKERLIEFGMRVYRFQNSLVYHDGNYDSKLNPIVRKTKKLYTRNFIDDEKKNK